MTTEIKEEKMGRFSVEIELANYEDLVRVNIGALSLPEVRRMRIRGVVDSGASLLVLPASAVQQLGLPLSGTAKVRYANGQTAERPIATGVQLSFGGRDGLFRAIVEPDRESALIGAIVLEDLDFVVDCRHQQLVPRDPDQITSEIE